MKDIFLVKKMLTTDKVAKINLPQKGHAPLPKYIFLVRDYANKNEIKKAMKDMYRVDVVAVNTINIPGRMNRFRNSKVKTSGYKKAVVTLKEGQKIEERK